MALTISSSAFAPQEMIPSVYTSDGKDISPPLTWAGVPDSTKSLALIVDDPDAPDPAAPKMTWVHWVLYNIPPNTQGLAQNISSAQLPPGTKEGLNDWKRTGYNGPSPPIGKHRYFFKLYALDIILPDLGASDKAKLVKAMQGHILDQAMVVGTYQR